MRSPFQPQIRVPGATKKMNTGGIIPTPVLDARGLPVWDMPEPSRYAEHTKWRKSPSTGERQGLPHLVPVYRGCSAKLARYFRAQARRNQRIASQRAAEQAAEEQARQEQIAADLEKLASEQDNGGFLKDA